MKPVLILVALLAAAVSVGCGSEQKASIAGSNEVRLEVTDAGFVPARAEVPRGQPFTLVVTRKTDQTCVKEIMIPALNERRALPLNQTVRIDVPKGVADTLNYVCQMDMVGGMIAAK
jgi:plastocyanin domain-containing protein